MDVSWFEGSKDGATVTTGAHEQRRSGALTRPPDPRATRSRAAALRAARELLAEQGWSAVTHVTVAARSGVGRTTLYRHWPDAMSLLHDAVAEVISQARSALTGDLQADLVQELNALRVLLNEPVTERGMRSVIERAGVDPAFSRLKEALYRSGSEGFRSIIEQAKSQGRLPADLDTDLAVDQLAGPPIFRRLLAGGLIDAAYVRAIADSFVRTYAPVTD